MTGSFYACRRADRPIAIRATTVGHAGTRAPDLTRRYGTGRAVRGVRRLVPTGDRSRPTRPVVAMATSLPRPRASTRSSGRAEQPSIAPASRREGLAREATKTSPIRAENPPAGALPRRARQGPDRLSCRQRPVVMRRLSTAIFEAASSVRCADLAADRRMDGSSTLDPRWDGGLRPVPGPDPAQPP